MQTECQLEIHLATEGDASSAVLVRRFSFGRVPVVGETMQWREEGCLCLFKVKWVDWKREEPSGVFTARLGMNERMADKGHLQRHVQSLKLDGWRSLSAEEVE